MRFDMDSRNEHVAGGGGMFHTASFFGVRSVFGRRWFGWLASVVLVVVACGGGGQGTSAALSEHVVGGDLQLVMQPGEGPGEEAEQLLAPVADPFGVKEGTADHVAWFDGEYGPVHVVTFTAGRDNPRGGEPEFCVMFGGGAGCGLDPDEPLLHDMGGDGASAYGGTGAAEAVFITESANTVSILTVEGYARAEWPPDWGRLEVVEFYDTTGSLLVKLDTQSDSTE